MEVKSKLLILAYRPVYPTCLSDPISLCSPSSWPSVYHSHKASLYTH